MLFEIFIEPFAQYLFMKRAIVACFSLSLGCTGVGVILVLRRMSLIGDALSHSALPGVAVGFLETLRKVYEKTFTTNHRFLGYPLSHCRR